MILLRLLTCIVVVSAFVPAWHGSRRRRVDALNAHRPTSGENISNRRRRLLLALPLLVLQRPTTASSHAALEDLLGGLEEATPERPAIPLPQNYQPDKQSGYVVEGLLSLKNPKSETRRPQPTDTILLTISTLNDTDRVIAAARVPVRRAPLPFRFRFDEANFLITTNDDILEQDWMVKATICPSTEDDDDANDPTTCGGGNNMDLLAATAVAKLLRLEQQQTVLRAPVSLALQ